MEVWMKEERERQMEIKTDGSLDDKWMDGKVDKLMPRWTDEKAN